MKLLFDIHYLFGLLNIYIWKSLNYFMVFKPVHVFSYICYLIWAPPWGPSRYQVHSRITYIIICIRTPALILRWRRSVYLLGSALTLFGLWWLWTIITLFYCTVYFRSEYKYICIYIIWNWFCDNWNDFEWELFLLNYSCVCLFPFCCIL